jgi:uncharacterized protein YjiS (DUF1127 family)
MSRFVWRTDETIRRAWARYAHRRQRLGELSELLAMNDVSLRDVGISRLDIQAAIRSDADLRSVRD